MYTINVDDTFYDFLINNNFFTENELANYYFLNELKNIKYEWYISDDNIPKYVNDIKKSIKDDKEIDKILNDNNNNVLYYLKNNIALNIIFNGDSNNYYKIREHEKMINLYYMAMAGLYNHKLYINQDNINKKLLSKIKDQNNIIVNLFRIIILTTGVMFNNNDISIVNTNILFLILGFSIYNISYLEK